MRFLGGPWLKKKCPYTLTLIPTGDTRHQYTRTNEISANQQNSMHGFEMMNGWDKERNHFLVYPHGEIQTVEDAKQVEMTTIDGST